MPILESVRPGRRAPARAPILGRAPSSPAPVPPGLAGLALGAVLGSLHALWVILVATGSAQRLTDGLYRLHMIEPNVRISAFRPRSALGLVLVTTGFGVLYGAIGAVAWNGLARARAPRAAR